MIALASCSPIPRVSSFDAASVAVEVAESEAGPDTAGTYALALLEFGDLESRYRRSQQHDAARVLLSENGEVLLDPDDLVWASVVTLDRKIGEGTGVDFGVPQRWLVLVDIDSGLPIYSTLLQANLLLPGGLHTVSELDRAP